MKTVYCLVVCYSREDYQEFWFGNFKSDIELLGRVKAKYEESNTPYLETTLFVEVSDEIKLLSKSR